MRYTVTKSVIQVVGVIWMPTITAAYQYELSNYDLRNIRNNRRGGQIQRVDIEDWLNKNSGDFQHIFDFRADLDFFGKGLVFDWTSEDSELTYNDCMFGGEE